MGQFRIPLNAKIPTKELLSDMPAGPKAMVRKGFSAISKLPESAHSILLNKVIATTGRTSSAEDEQLAKDLGISVDDATTAMAAIAMLSALASIPSREGETIEQLLQDVIEAGLATASEKPALLRILPKLQQTKPDFRKAMDTRELEEAVLPSFDEFEAVVDIRIGGSERSGFAIPVAIAFLDTDSRDQRIWFQLTKKDVESLVEKLNLVLKRFREAEELIAKMPPRKDP